MVPWAILHTVHESREYRLHTYLVYIYCAFLPNRDPAYFKHVYTHSVNKMIYWLNPSWPGLWAVIQTHAPSYTQSSFSWKEKTLCLVVPSWQPSSFHSFCCIIPGLSLLMDPPIALFSKTVPWNVPGTCLWLSITGRTGIGGQTRSLPLAFLIEEFLIKFFGTAGFPSA